MSPGIVQSLKDVATAFGVGYDTVRTWKRSGMPCREDGGYSLIEIAYWKWPRDNAAKLMGTQDGDLTKQLASLDLLERKIAIAHKELKFRADAEQLVDRAAAKAEQRRQFHAIRMQLETVPTRLASAFPPEIQPDVIAEAGHLIRLLLQSFAAQADPDGEMRQRPLPFSDAEAEEAAPAAKVRTPRKRTVAKPQRSKSSKKKASKQESSSQARKKAAKKRGCKEAARAKV